MTATHVDTLRSCNAYINAKIKTWNKLISALISDPWPTGTVAALYNRRQKCQKGIVIFEQTSTFSLVFNTARATRYSRYEHRSASRNIHVKIRLHHFRLNDFLIEIVTDLENTKCFHRKIWSAFFWWGSGPKPKL